MKSHDWVLALMVALTAVTGGMLLAELRPRYRMPALAVMVIVTGILLMLASMVFSRP